ncbi:MAG TPA: BatA and WFA domain-containing protein [Patescibacteria group bacterium]|nr:BatA and WFA domain-containing protein [Patescibacteria group bacterium]
MTFLNPLILLGLAAASIPVLLHLLNLRKLKTVEFSSLRFLKELQKTKIRRLKLRQILLLILRTLIVVFAVIAFARPAIKSSIPALGTHAKTSVVILLDNSFSMDISDERGNRLKQAKNIAQSIIGALKEGDEAAVIEMANSDNQRQVMFSQNFGFLKEQVQKLPVATATAELQTSLMAANLLLENSNNINREVYIITDAQRNISGENRDSVRVFNESVAVYAIAIGEQAKAAEQNLSVDSVNIVTRIFQLDKPIEIEAYVRNSSSRDAQGVIVSLLFNGERVAQRAVDIPANSVQTLQVAASPKSRGIVRASVEIEGDALDADNRRYFGFVIPPAPSVALLGNPQSTQFLSLVLQASQSAALIPMPSAQVSSINLPEYDMVILGGNTVTASDGARLADYIRNGGAALIFADKTTPIEERKQFFAQLGLAITEQTFSANQPAQFTQVDKNNQLFQGVFKAGGDNRALVESPKITRAFPASGRQSIIEMPGGAFLSETRIGEGRMLYCAVDAGGEWSNFPLTGLFPTLVYRSILYLTTREALGMQYVAGNAISFTLPKKYASGGNFKISDPAGVEFFRQAVSLPSGAVLSLGAVSQSGVYAVLAPDGKPVTAFAVNPPASESILVHFARSDFMNLLKSRVGEKTHVEFIEEPQNVVQSVARARIGTELWKVFVMLAVLCALAEMLVARNTREEVMA